MNKHWTSKIVIAGMTIALGMPVAMTYADKGDTVRERLNEDEEPKIVREARIVREGQGEELEYKAPEDGQVWLYDATNKEVLHSISLPSGQTYGINPKNDYVLVNGKQGETVKLDRKNTYRIYYVTAEARDAKNSKRSGSGSTASDNTSKNAEKRVKKTAETKVPDTAKVAMEGRDEELSVKATERGTYYLYDATNETVLDIYNVVEGDRLTISPRQNAISVNGEQISKDVELSRKASYRLLFDKRQ